MRPINGAQRAGGESASTRGFIARLSHVEIAGNCRGDRRSVTDRSEWHEDHTIAKRACRDCKAQREMGLADPTGSRESEERNFVTQPTIAFAKGNPLRSRDIPTSTVENAFHP